MNWQETKRIDEAMDTFQWLVDNTNELEEVKEELNRAIDEITDLEGTIADNNIRIEELENEVATLLEQINTQ